MDLASALPTRWAEVKPSPHRPVSLMAAWPIAASVVLHGLCLMALVTWNGADETALQVADTTFVVHVVPLPPQQTAAPPAPQQAPLLRMPQRPPAKRTSLTPTASPPAAVASTHAPSATAIPEGTGTEDTAADFAAGGTEEDKAGRTEGVVDRSPASLAVPAQGNPLPIYPVAARRAGREGRVVLLVKVTANGECAEATTAESSGVPALDEAAKTAVRRWRFVPGTQAGQKVETTLRVPITFWLRNGE
ncbi:MAG: energy transducer TonB [Bacteroidota bacterium]